jgi:hypothetical protein
MGAAIEQAVGVGYSGLDIYGIHALELYQAVVERRAGGGVGVRSVQCLPGEQLGEAVKQGLVDESLLRAALAVEPSAADLDFGRVGGEETALFVFEYLDGFRGVVVMLGGGVHGCRVALRVAGRDQPLVMRAEERTEPHYPHFGFLLHAIEQMIHTGRVSYPVERTLLTGGILDRALTSRAQGHIELSTPELAIRYEPVDYPHAPRPALPI